MYLREDYPGGSLTGSTTYPYIRYLVVVFSCTSMARDAIGNLQRANESYTFSMTPTRPLVSHNLSQTSVN